MMLEEFRRLAETWGGDIARWPETVRADATTFAGSAEAVAILTEASMVDRAVMAAAPTIAQHRVDDVVHQVVMRLAQQAPRGRAMFWPRWLAPSAAFAGAIAAGMLVGLIDLPDGEAPQDDVRTVLTQLFDNAALQQDWFVR